MRSLIYKLICVFVCLQVAALSLAAPDDTKPTITENRLEIDPVTQRTPAWCWLAVGEMIFTYFDLDELPGGYQCSTIGMFEGRYSSCWANCGNCPLPSGTMQNFERMITVYPRAVASFQREPLPSRLGLQSTMNALAWDDVVTEINHKRPVAAGISPGPAVHSHLPQHVVLIVGYKIVGDNHYLYVNDPFPYEGLGLDVYTRPSRGGVLQKEGQYLIEYGRFKSGLQWSYSAYGIEDPDHHRPYDELGAKVVTRKAPAAANAPQGSQTRASDNELSFADGLTKLVDAAKSHFALVMKRAQFGDYNVIDIRFPYGGRRRACIPRDSNGRVDYCSGSFGGDRDGTVAKNQFDDLDANVAGVLTGWTRRAHDNTDRNNGHGLLYVTEFEKDIGNGKHESVEVWLERTDSGYYDVELVVNAPK